MGSTDGRAAVIACAAALLAALFLFIGLRSVGDLGIQQAGVAGRLDEFLRRQSMNEQVLVTSWKYKAANGVCVTTSLSTPKGQMGTALWVRTHNEAVAVAQDPDQGGHAPDPECN